MRIILRTLCGCERVMAENAIFAPMPADIYVPIPLPLGNNATETHRSKIRRFMYWKQVEEDKIYLERDE